jgi:3-polyprenyl-4-hydroxybenzoate decarboxylase
MASAFRILGEGQLSLTKFLLVTDRHVDVRDFRATLEHILARSNPETDLYVFSNLSMDTLDYTGPKVNEGSKGVWLGLGDPVRDLPRQFSAAVPAGVTDVRVFCGGCLVVSGPAYAAERDAPARLAADPALAGWPLVVLSDDAARAVRSDMNFLWTTFTRFEPAADIHAASSRIVRNHIAYSGPVVIDARMKPWYPKELSCRPDIARRVSARWKEYFPSGGVEMGDSERGHLN